MDVVGKEMMEKFKGYRDDRLRPLAEWLAKKKVTATHVTSLSLVSALTAVWFLFSDFYLFTLFAVLHLFFDALDGVVARVYSKNMERENLSGWYYDSITDSLFTLLILVKAGIFLGDYVAFLAAGLFFFSAVICYTSKFEAPMAFYRTVAVIVVFLATLPGFPQKVNLLTLGVLVGGATSLYILAKQLQWYLKKRIRS